MRGLNKYWDDDDDDDDAGDGGGGGDGDTQAVKSLRSLLSSSEEHLASLTYILPRSWTVPAK